VKCKCGRILSDYRAKQCKNCYNSERTIDKKTIAEVKSKSDHPAYSHNEIRKRVRRQNKIKSCELCGYDKHVEVCHIKPIADFPDTALVSEVNDISNIKILCPNCHWEFDNLN